MVNPAGGARHSRFLFNELTRQPGTGSTDSKQKTFQLQLQRSLANSEPSAEVSSEGSSSSDGVSKRQAFANLAPRRQEVAAKKSEAGLAGPFGGAGVAIAPEKPAASAPANVSTASTDPLSVLRLAMEKAGIVTGIDLTVSDEIVQYPGGAYRNHQIKADFGDGITESYSVDLMMKNPWLTALEMKRLMSGAA